MFNFVDVPIYLSMFYFGGNQDISVEALIMISIWTLSWMIILGIQIYLLDKFSKLATIPLISSILLIPIYIVSLNFLSFYSSNFILDINMYTVFIIVNHVEMSPEMTLIFYLTLYNLAVPYFSGLYPLYFFIPILTIHEELIFATFFVGIAIILLKSQLKNNICLRILIINCIFYGVFHVFFIFTPLLIPDLITSYIVEIVGPGMTFLIGCHNILFFTLVISGFALFLNLFRNSKHEHEGIVRSAQPTSIVDNQAHNQQVEVRTNAHFNLLIKDTSIHEEMVSSAHLDTIIDNKAHNQKVEVRANVQQYILNNEIDIPARGVNPFITSIQDNREHVTSPSLSDMNLHQQRKEFGHVLENSEKRLEKEIFEDDAFHWMEDIALNYQKPSNPDIDEIKIKLGELIKAEQEKIEIDELKEENALDYLDRVRKDIKKYTSIYKKIKLETLAEKCNCSGNKLLSILEDLIHVKEVMGFIIDDFYIHHSISAIEEFKIRNKCDFCSFFSRESTSCSKLTREEISHLIDFNETCSLFKTIEKQVETKDIRDLQLLLKHVDKIEIVNLGLKLGISIFETESLLNELIDLGILKGEIQDACFIAMKNIDFSELDEYQPETGKNCGICYHLAENQDHVKCDECNAIFHRACINKYLEKFNRCPVCSAVFKMIF